MFRRLSLAILISLSVFGCSDDDEARTIRHYYYPVWSQDGSIIIAAYEDDFTNVNSPRPEVYELAVRDNATFSQEIIAIKPGILSKRYFITPENNGIVIVGDGIEFYDMGGNFLAKYSSSTFSTQPEALTFSTNDKSYYWATLSNNQVHVVRVTYEANAWEVSNETIVQSFPATSKPMDIKVTDQNTIIVALEEGRIVEYPFVGGLLHQFTYAPYPQANPWLRRLEYTFDDRANAVYVYTLNDTGLVRFDFTHKHDSLLVDGRGKYVIGFDAEDVSDAVVFEVSDGDIYNYKPALFRRAVAHRMPKFSPSGKKLVAVAYMNPGEDSLHVLQ